MGTCQLPTFTVGSEITERRSICFGNFFVVVLHFLTKLTFYIVNRDDRAAKNQCKFLRSDGVSHGFIQETHHGTMVSSCESEWSAQSVLNRQKCFFCCSGLSLSHFHPLKVIRVLYGTLLLGGFTAVIISLITIDNICPLSSTPIPLNEFHPCPTLWGFFFFRIFNTNEFGN